MADLAQIVALAAQFGLGVVIPGSGAHVVGQGPQVHRTIADVHCSVRLHPGERVLQPALVVAFGEVLARVGAAALSTQKSASCDQTCTNRHIAHKAGFRPVLDSPDRGECLF
mgnify:CR=1 FL=1